MKLNRCKRCGRLFKSTYKTKICIECDESCPSAKRWKEIHFEKYVQDDFDHAQPSKAKREVN